MGQDLEAFLIVNGITDEEVLRAKKYSSWSQKPLPLYGISQEVHRTERYDSLEYQIHKLTLLFFSYHIQGYHKIYAYDFLTFLFIFSSCV